MKLECKFSKHKTLVLENIGKETTISQLNDKLIELDPLLKYRKLRRFKTLKIR